MCLTDLSGDRRHLSCSQGRCARLSNDVLEVGRRDVRVLRRIAAAAQGA